jgi:acyl carrier protein
VEEIKEKIKHFILNDILEVGEDEPLDYDTPLLSEGILDSTSAVTLICFVEETCQIHFDAEDVDEKNLNTINALVKLVESKLSGN